jgi:hypothetical protein
LSDSEVFYFDVRAEGSLKGVKPIRASNLQTAKDCLEKFPGLISYKLINKADIPDEMLAQLSGPFDCPEKAQFKVGYKPMWVSISTESIGPRNPHFSPKILNPGFAYARSRGRIQIGKRDLFFDGKTWMMAEGELRQKNEDKNNSSSRRYCF